jgi:clan AA aspartic protease
MGNFTAEITLKNAGDIAKARDSLINEQDIRQVTIEAIPDTGASSLFITEDVCRKLGLTFKQEGYVNIADGARKLCKRTEAVEVHWKNRSTECRATVIPGSKKNLLGAIPLEDMDLRVNPVTMCLEGANGDEPVYQAL